MIILRWNHWDEDFSAVSKWYPEIDIDCTFDRCKVGFFKGVFYLRLPEEPTSYTNHLGITSNQRRSGD